MIAVGGLLGGVALLVMPDKLLAASSKTAAVFLGTVWVTVMAFAIKVADITEAPQLSPEEHDDLELKVRRAVRRVWLYAAGNAIAAVLVLFPSIIVEAGLPVPPLVALLAGAAVGFSVYSIIAHTWWQEELRRFRSTLRQRERAELRGKQVLEPFQKDTREPLSDEQRAEIARHNIKVEWPAQAAKH